MAEEKIDLAFDTNPFENAMRTIVKGVIRMTNKMEEANTKVQKSNERNNTNMKKGFSNVVAFGIAKFQILKSFLQKIISGMPEMTQVFKIAGDIIIKNLFWPLRRMLIPILQKVLNWVRENRVLFVKLGSVIANAFRVGMSVAKSFFNLLQIFFKSFQETIGKVLNFDSIIKGLNLAMFKIAFLFAFLEVKLRPFVKILGQLFGDIVILVKEFAKGFIEGMTGVDKKINLLLKLEKTFKGIHGLLVKLTPLLKPIGKLFGEIIGESIASTLVMLDSLITGINTLIDLLSGKIKVKDIGKSMKEWFAKKENLLKLFETTADLSTMGMTKGTHTILNKLVPEKKVDDAIIKPNGTIIKTNPLDTIIAMKNPEKTISDKNMSIGDMNININVTEGNAKDAGINFGMGLKETIRTFFLDEALG